MINVEVAYATGKYIELIPITVSEGTTVMDAIRQSGMLHLHPEVDVSNGNIGIYSRPCPGETVLKDGDRVEIYRPLKADPKEARRRRAARQDNRDA